jgi:formamidopyrimidine-DNA glycosylase
MPELPEVETVRRSLLDFVPGRKIVDVVVGDPYVLRGQPVDQFQASLRDQSFQDLERHGKLLFFPFDAQTLIVHLGMTGQLTLRRPDRADTRFIRHHHTGLQRTLQHPPDQHTHISLMLDDGSALHYRDVRKFGRVFTIPQTSRSEIIARFRLGIDPLTADFSPDYLAGGLRNRKAPIKAALLDQSFLAGLGNIYADEALFQARIRPGRACYRVRGRSLEALAQAIVSVLHQGLQAGGTTLRDFVDGSGQSGYNQEGLQAYGRYGQPCLACGDELRRSTVAGRTTSWCARCQK